MGGTPGSHSLACRRHTAVQPQIYSQLSVNIPGVANQEADDSRARGGAKELRRRPRALEQRLIRLLFQESDAVVERIVQRFEGGVLGCRLWIDRRLWNRRLAERAE